MDTTEIAEKLIKSGAIVYQAAAGRCRNRFSQDGDRVFVSVSGPLYSEEEEMSRAEFEGRIEGGSWWGAIAVLSVSE